MILGEANRAEGEVSLGEQVFPLLNTGSQAGVEPSIDPLPFDSGREQHWSEQQADGRLGQYATNAGFSTTVAHAHHSGHPRHDSPAVSPR